MTTRLFPIAVALFFVSASLHAAVLVGNFWHNPTFESGTDLNQATGTPDFWNRGGSDGSIRRSGAHWCPAIRSCDRSCCRGSPP